MSLFDPASKEEHHQMLASHLPSGVLWEQGFDADDDFGKLISALSVEFYRKQVLSKRFVDEFNINTTEDWIELWEDSVGIPDSVFGTNVDLETRIAQVILKFSNYGGAQTEEDFIRIAAFFGIEIEITIGEFYGTFPLLFPIAFFETATAATHVVFVKVVNETSGLKTFPIPFPVPLSAGTSGLLRKIFETLLPIDVAVAFTN